MYSLGFIYKRASYVSRVNRLTFSRYVTLFYVVSGTTLFPFKH